MESATPRVLGEKYRLIRQLDQGGMGSVWYAEHLVLNAPVAVKVLEFGGAESEAAVARFLREAQMAASLRSPHVVQILDYGVDEGKPYIVMELLVGESLAQRLARAGRLSPSETDRVITQVSRAIGRAHEAGIVHRDLKPANVFVVQDADVELIKVLDFGIAKAPASVHANTQSGTFLGTPAYASPEQIQAVRALDHRSDLWSLGVIAFECLLGLRPFEGETFGAIVVAVCSKPLRVPSTCGAVPVGFDAWFATACAREPAQRFASAREAADALSRVCAAPLTAAPSRTERIAVETHALGQQATVPDSNETGNSTQRAASVPQPVELPRARARGRAVWFGVVIASVLVTSITFLRGGLRGPSSSQAAGALSAAGAGPAPASTPAPAPAPGAPSEPTGAPERSVPPEQQAAPDQQAPSEQQAPRSTPVATPPNAPVAGTEKKAAAAPPRKAKKPRAKPGARGEPPEPPAEIDLGL